MLGLEPPPPFLDVDRLLGFFGVTTAVARERYRACVEETEEPLARTRLRKLNAVQLSRTASIGDHPRAEAPRGLDE
jgi:hypothetical protein